MVLNGQVYLTDFGTVAPYKNAKGDHIPETNLAFSGTLNFAPINAHQGKVTTRRDDLEMLGYSILYMLLGE
jgi:serine/threonine protein kinase